MSLSPTEGLPEKPRADGSDPGACPVCGEALVAFPEYSPATERRALGRPPDTLVSAAPPREL